MSDIDRGAGPWEAQPRRWVVVTAGLAVALIAGGIGAGVGVALADRHNASQATDSTAVGNGGRVSGVTNSSVAAIAGQVSPGVLDVTTTLGYQSGGAAGTAMVLTSSGEVLTNNHVINGATKITVQVDGKGRTYTARVLGTDPTDDVALLQIDGASGLKTVKLGDSSKVAVGDPVVAIGNALNLQGPPTVTDGTVTALGRSITVSDPSGPAENLTGLIETNALLRRGDSGGPLANTSGEVIGMNTAASAGRGFRAGPNTGFAIPINKAKAIADQIKAGHGSSSIHIGLPAFMGVETQPGSTGSGAGAVLSGVVPHTPAQAAGLVAGDTIVAVDGKTVRTRSDLTQLLGNHRPGDHVQVGWVDQSGKHHLTTVALIAGPAD